MVPSFEAPLERFENSDLWGFHFIVPDEIAAPLVAKEDRRVVCSLEGKLKFHCALMPLKNDGWFIMVNKKNRDKLGLVLGQLVKVSLEKDTSDYGMPMPEELMELMRQDEDGYELFHALTPGKQRNLIYIVGQVKSPDIRLRRALVIVEHLKMQHGKIDFKMLHQELKAANQRDNRR